MTRHNVVVLGGGPAALAAAAACVRAGLSVLRVEVAAGHGWSSSYGVWIDQLEGLDLDATLGPRWDGPTVLAGELRVLPRAYALFDGAALRAALAGRAAGAEVVEGRAVGANHDRWGSTVILHDGRLLDATVVVDATGHWPVLVHRAERPARATRMAYAIVARCSAPPYGTGCMLMDWSGGDAAAPGPEVRSEVADPSFSTALELDDGWWLLGETSLARRPPLAVDVLQARLHRRLAERGVEVKAVRSIEETEIPLGLALPDLDQRAVGLGGSAGLVHPVTGHSVGASLRVAPHLAVAIAQAIERRATPEAVSAAAWSAVWPAGRRRARAFEEVVLRGLLRLDAEQTREFAAALFSLDDADWYGFLTGELAPREQAAMLRRLLASLPRSVRAKLRSPRLASPVRPG